MDFEKIAQDRQLDALFLYGSRVYGTASDKSDFDFIGIGKENRQETGDFDITCYSHDSFRQQLDSHEISVLECCWQIPLFGQAPSVTISLPLLRKSISAKASNSFVKAKKKYLVVEDFDPYVGIKSLFHSFRILTFGLQIANKGKIYDYSAANHYWQEMNARSPDKWSWDELNSLFKARHNALSTEFRLAAPKE